LEIQSYIFFGNSDPAAPKIVHYTCSFSRSGKAQASPALRPAQAKIALRSAAEAGHWGGAPNLNIGRRSRVFGCQAPNIRLLAGQHSMPPIRHKTPALPPKTGQRTHTGNGPAAAAKALRPHRTTLHQQETAFRPLRTSTPPARERHPPIFPKIRPQSARREILRPGGRNFAQFFLHL